MAERNIDKQRVVWIDYAKGIGIFLVVYGHVIRGLKDSNIINESFFNISDKFVYSFHMPLFFILSGMFFTRASNKPFVQNLNIKLKTLIYPFIIWSLIQTIIEIFLSKYTNHKTPLTDLFSCLIIPRAQFWFLYALFFINLINLILFKISSQNAIYISMGICLIYYIFNIDLGVFNRTFEFLFYFNIGIFISKIEKEFTLLIKNKIAFLFVLGAFFTLESFYIIQEVENQSFFLIILSILGFLLISQISLYLANQKIVKIFVDLGKSSIAIYLVHILVASGIRIILLKIFKIDLSILHIFVGTFLGLAIPFLMYKFFIKNKYLSWVFVFPRKT